MGVINKQLPAEQRRDVTIMAVIELAQTQNPTDITTAAIAEHMNLTQGAIFRHFPTKDAIWQAVMEWVASNLLEHIDNSAKGIDKPLEILRAMFQSHISFIQAHSGVPRMMVSELQKPTNTPAKQIAQTLQRNYFKRVQNIIETGQRQNEIDQNIDSEAAAVLFLGTIQGLVMQTLIAGNTTQLSNNATRVFEIYLNGIRHKS